MTELNIPGFPTHWLSVSESRNLWKLEALSGRREHNFRI